MTLDLQTLPPQAREVVRDLQAENSRLQTLLKLREEQIRFLHLQRWGPKADQLSEAQLALLPQELLVAPPEVQREAELPEAQKALIPGPRAKAPIRRGFVDAAKLAPLDPLPVEIVGQIGLLYEVEREARAQNLSAAARRELRQRRSQPVLGTLKTRLVQIRQEVTPASALAQACDYALGQWSRLEEYLTDGEVEIEIDNNWCEGGMRPVALGRKNWLHLGDQSAGPKLAAIISIVETCRRLEIKLRDYLRDILPRLGNWPINRVAELTPTAWKAARTS